MDVPNVTRTEYTLINIDDVSLAECRQGAGSDTELIQAVGFACFFRVSST
jgi:hypothetical protein